MHPYNSLILEHFRAPRNVGEFAASEIPHLGSAQVGMAGRSNVMQLQLKWASDKTICAARYKIHGCGVAIAAASWLSERLQGLTLAQAQSITHEEISRMLDLPPFKRHCAILAEDALCAAIADYQHKQQALTFDEETVSQ